MALSHKYVENENLYPQQSRINLYTLQWDTLYIRVVKTRSLGPWSKVIVYCSKLSFMNMLQGHKDPFLPTLLYILHFLSCNLKNLFFDWDFWGHWDCTNEVDESKMSDFEICIDKKTIFWQNTKINGEYVAIQVQIFNSSLLTLSITLHRA
jgi:hypothetical protein